MASSVLVMTAALTLATTAQAEVTQDCILEGTVDLKKAEQLGQSTYVKFRNAKRGAEAGCSLNRRSKSRRVQYISSPDTNELVNVSHGSTVKYRYVEWNNQPGSWELIDIQDRSQI